MLDQITVSNNELEKFGYNPTLHRTLTKWQLTAFGLTYLQPIGPAVVFGFLLSTSGGSVALPYLFAFIGMIFTISSYSVLIKNYPLSGSIYNYVKFVCGDFWGFIAGWLLALDYILIPTITSVSAAIYAHQLIPIVSYESWLAIFVISMGLVNLCGIKSTSKFNTIILLVQIIVVILSFIIWMKFFVHTHTFYQILSIRPFHFESIKTVLQASSIAIFSFLGFDAVTTMAEESINPRKAIPKAMMICTCIGFLIMFLTGYLGVLLMPDWRNLITDTNWINASLFNLAKLTGGNFFAFIYTVGFILAMAITNLIGTTAASRLLFAMGRDNKIPRKIFGVVNKKWKTPHGNILFIIISELILGSVVNQDRLAELINFGAISGFILLNLSLIFLGLRLSRNKIDLYEIKDKKVFWLKFFLFPLIALMVMFAIFVNMKKITLSWGAIWFLFGLIANISHKYKFKHLFDRKENYKL